MCCAPVEDTFINSTLYELERGDQATYQMLIPNSPCLSTAVEVLLEFKAVSQLMHALEHKSMRKLHKQVTFDISLGECQNKVNCLGVPRKQQCKNEAETD